MNPSNHERERAGHVEGARPVRVRALDRTAPEATPELVAEPRTVRLAELQPTPPATSRIGQERHELLEAAARQLGLADQWDAVELPVADLGRLRHAVEELGHEHVQRHVASGGPFTDAAGYQWRSVPRYPARARRSLLERLDRLAAALQP